DLTVDGSLPLGAAVAATLIVSGLDPFFATFMAMVAGAMAGVVTGWLNVRLKILHLLASILTMIALYSVNLRIMGRPNVPLLGERTVFTPVEEMFDLPYYWTNLMVLTVVVVVAKVLIDKFLYSEIGLAMRATGANPRMARAQGIRTDLIILLGVGLSNALVALTGALFAQVQGTADISMGVGVIVVGLAAVILGEAVMSARIIFLATFACIAGSIVYRLAVALALNAGFLGLQAQDLKLITAVLVATAMTLPGMRKRLFRQRKGSTDD
ncbi:MAG: ABC transporter permease, partial [Rhodospirillaceae bacterium]|nr:ABC transporter permease [Rhodospirillaceae bacterium]